MMIAYGIFRVSIFKIQARGWVIGLVDSKCRVILGTRLEKHLAVFPYGVESVRVGWDSSAWKIGK